MTTHVDGGHGKNIANFEVLISYCASCGGSYNPNRPELAINAMKTLLGTSQSSVSKVISAKNGNNMAINARQILFAPVRQLSMRIVYALEASGASQQTVDDAQGINRKMQNRRSTPKPEAGTGKRSISTAQLSYSNVIDHLMQLVAIVTSEPLYNPNEDDLKVEALNEYIHKMKATTTFVVESHTAYTTARHERDRILYGEKTGLVDIAMDVKKYIRSVFGNLSTEYKDIIKIKFTRRH
ncbi:MAG: hypothetical protein LBV41_10065 [Cytophagaceae bacterium]|jgi:hypothetical protein|nr:hypothetical protein [Cytophagaceae bacterium]